MLKIGIYFLVLVELVAATASIRTRPTFLNDNVTSRRNPKHWNILETPKSLEYQMCNQNSYNFEVGQQTHSINIDEGDASRENSYILFLGQSDHEKTSTMNILFPKSFSQEMEENSEVSTPEIIEYTINVSLSHNSGSRHLRIIDIPQLVSYRSKEQDLVILANWILHLRNNQVLYSKPPTLVLIFTRFDDPWNHGPSSTFLNFLKNVNRIRESFIPENATSNILHVLTNFLRETKVVTQKPAARFDEFRHVIRNYTEFPKPINLCVAENDGERYGLPIVGDNFLLSKKILYPDNLIKAIEAISSNSSDKMARNVIKSTFANRKTLAVTRNKFKILGNDDPRVIEILEILKAMEEGKPINPVSEVSSALSDTYGKIDYHLRRMCPGSLEFLQKAFQNKGIKQRSQIPKTSSEIANFLRGIHMNLAMVALFENAFSIKIPKIPFHPLVGFGYNILEDKRMETTPFIFPKFKSSSLGFMIPEGITGKLTNTEVDISLFFENMDSYKRARLLQLSAPEGNHEDNFIGKLRSGYNIVQSNYTRVTFAKEFRQFSLTLDEDVKFNQDFLNTLEELPVFNVSSQDSVNNWKRLFHIYGTHVVISASGGTNVHSAIVLKNTTLLEKYRGGDLNTIRCAFKNSNLKQRHHRKLKMFKTNLTLVPLSDLITRTNSSIAIETENAMIWLIFKGASRKSSPIVVSNITLEDQRPPVLINIPETLDEILTMQVEPDYQYHPGLEAAKFAVDHKRSSRNAYILCLGLEGAGKSSTLNFLFGRKFVKANGSFTKESQIMEYFADVPIPEVGVNNSQLRIIDTPGLDMTGGREHDARMITNLVKYLSSHEDLKSALPNIVLIFSNFDDNRFVGPESTFVKMLKAYNGIREKFAPPAAVNESSNIIFVLTRYLSESDKIVRRDPRKKLDLFRDLIRKYTSFPEPIVISLAENEPEEMPQIDHNYKLPNGELYPQNLIDRIVHACSGLKEIKLPQKF